MAHNSVVNKPSSPLSETRIALLAPIICIILVALYAISTKAVLGQKDASVPIELPDSIVSAIISTTSETVASSETSDVSLPSSHPTAPDDSTAADTSQNSSVQVWVNDDEVPMPENMPAEQTITTPTGTVQIETSGTSDSNSSTRLRLNIRSESENDEEVRIKSRIRIDE